MADYTGAGIFSSAKRDDSSGVVSDFVSARLAESEARQAELAPAPATKIPSLLAAVMRGNAQVQTNVREKEFKQKVDQALAKVKITEHGDGTVDVKGAPAEFFEGKSMVAEGKAAVEEPMAKVEQALAPPPQPAIAPAAVAKPEEVTALEGMYQANDAVYGKRLPRPYEVDELVKTPEGIRKLTFLMGGTEQHAKINIERAKREQSRELLANNLTRNLVKMHAGLYEKTKPAIDDSQQNRRADTELTKEKRRTFEAFLGNNLVDIGSEDDAVSTARERIESSGLAWSPSDEKEVRSTYRGQQRKLNAAATQTVATRISAMKDDDIKGYGGDFNQWLANTEGALGVTFTPAQRGAAEARFKGITKEVRDAEAKVELDRHRTATRESLQLIQEARRTATAERQATLDALKIQGDTEAKTRTKVKDQDARIEAAETELRNLDKEIRANNLAFSKTDDPTERAELQRQAALLVARIPLAQEKMYDALGVISQEEWDELIALGHAPQELSARGIRAVRKRKK
jgi:hypothetical protein